MKNANVLFKFELLLVVVMNALSVHHGNSDVEQSLSDNKNTLTKDCICLSDVTLAVLRNGKIFARAYKGAQNIVINKNMIEATRNNFANKRRLEEEEETGEVEEY